MPGRGMLWSGAVSSLREYIPGVHPSGSRCPPIRFRVSTHQVPGVHPSGSGCPPIMFRVSTHHVPGVHPSGSGCPPIMLPYYREGRARVSPDSTGGG